MTMKIVVGLRVSLERRTQEKEVVGTFLTMKLQCFAIDKRITGHAAFDGRSVKANVIVNTHLIITHSL
jgi:hypothetical protein